MRILRVGKLGNHKGVLKIKKVKKGKHKNFTIKLI